MTIPCSSCLRTIPGGATSIDGGWRYPAGRHWRSRISYRGQYLDIRLINKGNLPIKRIWKRGWWRYKGDFLDPTTAMYFCRFSYSGRLLWDWGLTMGMKSPLTASDSLRLERRVTLDSASVGENSSVRQTKNELIPKFTCMVEDIAFYPSREILLR